MKRNVFSFADLLDDAADQLRCASTLAWEARLREAERAREMGLLAETQLRERSLRGGPVDFARYAAAGERELLLRSCPQRFERQIRELTARLRAHTDSLPSIFAAQPARMRRGERSRKERLCIDATAQRLVALALEYEVGSVDMPIARIAHEHLHLAGTATASCLARPCPRLAICRCLFDIVDAMPSPAKLAVRELADVEFDVAAWLDGIRIRIARALPADAQQPEGPNRDLSALLVQVCALADEIRALERETRARLLSAPKDLVPRGRRTKDDLALSCILHLHRAACPLDVISAVIVLEPGRDGSMLPHAVRNLLKRYSVSHRAWRTRHSSTPDA